MKTSQLGIDLVKHFESLHDGDLSRIGLQPKLCPANIVTIGYGHMLRDLNGSPLKGVDGYRRMLEIYPEYETITKEEAEDLLKEDLVHFEDQLNSLNMDLKQHEFDALLSFIFNCGFGNFLQSRLYQRVKSRRGDIETAFMMWVKANGKELPGLVKRRRSEFILFDSGELDFN